MVEATLADLVGGEMLFPGHITPAQDRAQRIVQMRRLFDEAMASVKAGDFDNARACLNGVRLMFDVAVSVHAEKAAAESQE